MRGGPLIDILASIANFNSKDEFIREARRKPLHSKLLSEMTHKLKKIKVLLTHLHHYRKLRSIGPPANDNESSFSFNGKTITVANYFEITCRSESAELLRSVLPEGRLKYPFLPTINIGSTKRAVLIPCELVIIPPGQSKPVDTAIQAQVVRIAAINADERFK